MEGIFSEEVAAMLLYLPSAGCVRGLRKPGRGGREGTELGAERIESMAQGYFSQFWF